MKLADKGGPTFFESGLEIQTATGKKTVLIKRKIIGRSHRNRKGKSDFSERPRSGSELEVASCTNPISAANIEIKTLTNNCSSLRESLNVGN